MSQDITDIIKPIVICIMNKCLVCRFLTRAQFSDWLTNQTLIRRGHPSAFFSSLDSRILTELYVEKGYRCYG